MSRGPRPVGNPRRPPGAAGTCGGAGVLAARVAAPDAADIDRLYGLEPVYEPGAAHAALGEYVEFLCPYCCENIGTAVDLTGGSRSYIEDCQTCCAPMQITLEIGLGGELRGFEATRTD